MSRAYYHQPRYIRRPKGRAVALALMILLGYLLWIHRLAGLSLFIGLCLVGVILVFKLMRVVFEWRRIHNPQITAVDAMTGLEFERFVARILKSQGYKHVYLTEQYDLGVDIVAEKDGVRFGVQVKRYTGLVKALAVRQAVTALKTYNCDRGMVITNSNFSQVAKRLADSNDCILVSRDQLTRWVKQSQR